MSKNHEINISGAPEQNTRESLEDLKNSEVSNVNNEVDAQQVNCLADGVVSGVSPTDSIQPYKDAVKKALERDYLEFLYSQSMGSWKSWAYVGYLEKQLSLTEEQASAAQKEIYTEFQEGTDPSDWNIFLNGTPEQREALQSEIACEMYGEDPYLAAPDQSGDSAVAHTIEGPAASECESELHEARVSRALDKSGVNGPTGWSPEALLQALREEGVDAEWRSPQDGRVGGIFIFRPGGRERSKNYIGLLSDLRMGERSNRNW